MVRTTSIRAYHDLKQSGQLGSKQIEIYDALAQYGPATANELWQSYRHEHDVNANNVQQNFGARLFELREMGLVIEESRRKCRVTGRVAIVWAVAENPIVTEPKPKGPTNKQLTEALTAVLLSVPWPVEVIRKTHPKFAEAVEAAKKLMEVD